MSMRLTVLAAAFVAFACPASASPTFILTDTGGVGVGTQARAGFEAAAAIWAGAFTDKVTIRLNVGFTKLDAGILGETGSTSSNVSYSAFRSAYAKDVTSSADASALANLGPRLAFESNSLNGITSATTRLYDTASNYDNLNLNINSAEQKALGLLSSSSKAADASITFSSAYRWAFDASNGVPLTSYDFVGIAAHEIGYALGFVSGVDDADFYAKYHYLGLTSVGWVTPLDLFRYQNGVRDLTVGGAPCFSIDGGATCGPTFSTGSYYGDKRQASHWKDNLHLGVMDPTAARGETLQLTTNDLTAFDVLGWNLAADPQANAGVHWAAPGSAPLKKGLRTHATVPVPEPGSFGVLAAAALGAGLARRRANLR